MQTPNANRIIIIHVYYAGRPEEVGRTVFAFQSFRSVCFLYIFFFSRMSKGVVGEDRVRDQELENIKGDGYYIPLNTPNRRDRTRTCMRMCIMDAFI